ncbi:MAG: hypothetical protein RMI79_02655 [Nitrososphaerota archaeon]|nr:hypothetical protein [Nitrososphaerota archaeon]
MLEIIRFARIESKHLGIKTLKKAKKIKDKIIKGDLEILRLIALKMRV